MIQLGDKVRFKNSYLNASSVLAPGSKPPGKKKRKKGIFRGRRGQNELRTVVKVNDPIWDWRRKKWNQIVKLDNGKHISVHWLVVVRKASKKDIEKMLHEAKEALKAIKGNFADFGTKSPSPLYDYNPYGIKDYPYEGIIIKDDMGKMNLGGN